MSTPGRPQGESLSAQREGSPMTTPRTLFDKLWDSHVVTRLDDERALIHIDRHVLHDLSSPQAFSGLQIAKRPVRNAALTFATADHLVSTDPDRGDDTTPGGREMIVALRDNTRAHGITHFDLGNRHQGIVHVVAPELGIALPGMTIVCGDSHTCTLGALGSWAFGIGTSEVEHVLATQTLVLRRPRTMRLTLTGRLSRGVTAKDLALAVIRHVGVDGARGMALEFAGPVVTHLSMEARFTLCNMGIEAGARSAMIAPDDVTFEYVAARPYAPRDFDRALRDWRALPSDDGALYDAELALDVSGIAPQITWGTTPAQTIGIDEAVPSPAGDSDAALATALDYMGVTPNRPIEGLAVSKVFIGSCTNGRLSDLEAAAQIASGRKVAPGVRALVVPGSEHVRRDAEARGLDRVFRNAGFEWRAPGCSMCVGMNADQVGPLERCVSTSNRNFEGRQGPRARTHLASPAMAAAAAIAGRIVDVRRYLD